MNIGLNGRPSLTLLFVNGKGASGKDTQADLLLEGNPHAARISTGDAIRSIGENTDHPLYAEIKPQIDAANEQGKLLSDDVVLKIVDAAVVDEIRAGNNTLVFTGYPRTEGQLDALDGLLSDMQDVTRAEGQEMSAKFLHYDISDEISRERAASRRVRYELEGKTIRKDDDPEVVEKRLATYREFTQPMIDRLSNEGRLLNIDASGSIEQVAELTREALGIKPSMLEGNPRPLQERK
jgi:adenylate kinase